jgi:Calx-beta domain
MYRITSRRVAALALTTTALAAAGAGSASAAPAVLVTEGDSGNAFAEVALAVPPSLVQQVVNWSTADGTATDGVDYGGQPSGLLVFAPLATVKSVFIPVQGDTVHEADETFDVTFSGGPLASPVTQTVTIVDDDPAPEIKVSDVTVHESDGTARFDVGLSAPSGAPVEADWSTADGTAHAPGDYAAKSGHVTFAPGETTKSVTVELANDSAHEASEQFALRLSNVTGASSAKPEGMATILDDDPEPPAPPASQNGTPSTSTPHAVVGPGVRVAHLSRLRYAGRKGGTVRVTVWCPKAADCGGMLRLSAGGRVVGRAPFVLHKGQHRTLRIRLSRAARTALARHHRLRIKAYEQDGRSIRFTVR